MRRIALFVAAAAAALLPAAGSAATLFWAFGDSITRGEGLNIALDPDGSSCHDDPYPLECGYHWRLEDALGPIASAVLNRGDAGEATPDGVTRIEELNEPLETSRCTDPDAGDVLLLMEGTNNVSGILSGMPGISTESTKDDLAMMLELATTKCVHGAVASIIRRLKAGTPNGSWEGDPLEPTTLELKDKIIAMAALENRAYVPVWESLCPNQPCYNVNFWDRFFPADPGHVDHQGYDVMSPIFETVITATPLPGAATLTSPAGDVTDSTPPFTWNEHAHSDWYFLEVDGGASYGRWHPEEDVCTGGVCSFDPGVVLADGDHAWRLRTRNLQGVGSWSGATAFAVWANLPGATAPAAPAGDGCEASAGPYAPVYQWNEATSAKDYRLEVTDVGSATVVLDQLFAASAQCGGGSCSVTPATFLPPGEYSWRVRATNPFGDGPWSGATVFSRFPATLDAPAPIYPLDDVFEGTSSFPPTYRWTGAAGAEDYDVDVDGSTTTHPAGAVCTGLSCGLTGAAIAVGPHTWEATAKNRCDLTGASTGAQPFDVLTCTMPKDEDLPAPGAPVAGSVDESACGELRALAGYVVGGTGIVGFHGGEAVVLGAGFEVEAGGRFTARVDH